MPNNPHRSNLTARLARRQEMDAAVDRAIVRHYPHDTAVDVLSAAQVGRIRRYGTVYGSVPDTFESGGLPLAIV